MGSSEHNSAYNYLPSKQADFKQVGIFFIMFSLNMPTYPVILQI